MKGNKLSMYTNIQQCFYFILSYSTDLLAHLFGDNLLETMGQIIH
jgi:hypothetical protein